MSELLDKNPPEEAISDELSLQQMVESIANRVSKEKRRRFPRFPTSRALAGESVVHGADGYIACTTGSREAASGAGGPDGDDDGEVPREVLRPDRSELENLTEITIVDFSEEGAQFKFHCDNPTMFARKSLYLCIRNTVIPVAMQWCEQPKGNARRTDECRIRGGFTFAVDVDSTPELAVVLVDLSNRLVQYLLELEGQYRITEKRGAVLAFVSLLYNLRFKFLEAVALLNEAKKAVREVVPGAYPVEVLTVLSSLKCPRKTQVKEAVRLLKDSEARATLKTFMRPFQRYGCCFLGRGEQAILLANDVLNTLLYSLILSGGKSHRPPGLIHQVRHTYNLFEKLRAKVPGLFDAPEFVDQFGRYSHRIKAICVMREKLIDFLSRVKSEEALLFLDD